MSLLSPEHTNKLKTAEQGINKVLHEADGHHNTSDDAFRQSTDQSTVERIKAQNKREVQTTSNRHIERRRRIILTSKSTAESQNGTDRCKNTKE